MTKPGFIPFNLPSMVGRELEYIVEAVRAGHLAGDGAFTRRCQQWLEERCGARKVLLTHSCTAALEMAALLCDAGEGDEVIMPSFTFVSTANAFALRGARPVFVDVRPDTLNMDEKQIEGAITERTRAIVAVHYAGIGCDMDAIVALATRYGLPVVEDAAQALGATYRARSLGTIGDLGCWSFHETKNFISGEGGALVIQNPALIERAEIVREKGTNRSRFFRERSTSTRGSAWALPTCRRSWWPRSFSHNWSMPTKSSPGGEPSSLAITTSSRRSKRPVSCACRSCRLTVCPTGISSTSSSRARVSVTSCLRISMRQV